jgi:hypothetical protein
MAYIVKKIISIGNMYVGYKVPTAPAGPEFGLKTQAGDLMVTHAGEYIIWR